MRDAFEIAAGMPWLITEDGLERLLAVAARDGLDARAVEQAKAAYEASPEAVAMRGASRLPGATRATMRDGVAVVPVIGPIMRYANMFTAVSGLTSTAGIGQDFQLAVDDPSIAAIVVTYDTPGGEATGIAELAVEMMAARGKKPIIAYVSGMAASAGYWLAVSGDEVVLSPTAIVGSIGAVMNTTDTSQRDAVSGVRRTRIVSSQSPLKALDPASRSGGDAIQGVVDALAEQFIAHVATARGVSPETVASDFGKGGLVPRPADAIKLGMADRIGTFEGLMRELQVKFPVTGRTVVSLAPSSSSRLPMSTPALSTTSDDYTRGVATGIASERQRCAAIFALPEASARLDVARHIAFTTDLTPTLAAEMLKQAVAPQSGAPLAKPASETRPADGPQYMTPAGGAYAPSAEADALARSCLAAAGIVVPA